MARAISKLDVIIAGLVEVNTLEGAIDSQNLFRFAIGRRREILRLSFRQANDSRSWRWLSIQPRLMSMRMDIKRG
jgi:hypothetical protein